MSLSDAAEKKDTKETYVIAMIGALMTTGYSGDVVNPKRIQRGQRLKAHLTLK